MSHKFILGTLCLLFFGCSFQKQPRLEGDYHAYWAETHWNYHFEDNGTFRFETSGHFGDAHSAGLYQVNGDTFVLNSDPKPPKVENHEYLVFKNDLFVLSDSAGNCFQSLTEGPEYEYCHESYNAIIMEE